MRSYRTCSATATTFPEHGAYCAMLEPLEGSDECAPLVRENWNRRGQRRDEL
jgi:hypothetical protein